MIIFTIWIVKYLTTIHIEIRELSHFDQTKLPLQNGDESPFKTKHLLILLRNGLTFRSNTPYNYVFRKEISQNTVLMEKESFFSLLLLFL